MINYNLYGSHINTFANLLLNHMMYVLSRIYHHGCHSVWDGKTWMREQQAPASGREMWGTGGVGAKWETPKINVTAIRVSPSTSAAVYVFRSIRVCMLFSFSSFSFFLRGERKSRHIWLCLQWNHNIHYTAGLAKRRYRLCRPAGDPRATPEALPRSPAGLMGKVTKHAYLRLKLRQKSFIEGE